MEKQSSEPNFWNDNEKAQEILKKLTTEKSWTNDWDAIYNKAEELEILLDLAHEENDEKTFGEISSDLEIAANILRGNKIHKNVRMLVIPASMNIYRQMIEKGLIQIFIEAGCVICNSGCGPCLGAHQGILADGEICIATTNRNFKGRMGSPNSEVYLASPATVASSAIQGKIAFPATYKNQ